MTARIAESPSLGGAVVAPGAGLLSWLAALWQARRSELTREDREALNLIEVVRSRFGEVLLAADSVEDLHDRIDRRIDDPELTHVSALLLPLVKKLATRDAPRVGDIAAAAERVLGRAQVETLLRSEPLLQAYIAANLRLLGFVSDDVVAEAREAAARGISLFGPEVPVEIGRSLAGSAAAALCLVAIQAAMDRETPLEPWLAHALVGHLVDSVREAMRFFAGVPKLAIPEAVVPLEDRLDLPMIEQRHVKARERARAQLERERTKRAGAGSAGDA